MFSFLDTLELSARWKTVSFASDDIVFLFWFRKLYNRQSRSSSWKYSEESKEEKVVGIVQDNNYQLNWRYMHHFTLMTLLLVNFEITTKLGGKYIKQRITLVYYCLSRCSVCQSMEQMSLVCEGSNLQY